MINVHYNEDGQLIRIESVCDQPGCKTAAGGSPEENEIKTKDDVPLLLEELLSMMESSGWKLIPVHLYGKDEQFCPKHSN